MALTLRALAEGMGWTYVGPPSFLDQAYEGVSIDSRGECRGKVFVALKGARHDGHRFVAEAWRKGSPVALVDREMETPSLVVTDTLRALQDMASFLLDRWAPLVVAVTGSSGKTTTKDLLATLLGTRYRVHRTRGNYNNLVGLPFTVANMPPTTEVAVLEMGTNAPGEIARLGAIARPHIGVLTNIGRAHLGPLGGLEGVKRAKGELLEGIRDGGLLVYNADDPACRELAKAFPRTLSFGLKGGDVRGVNPRLGERDGGWWTSFTLEMGGKSWEVSIPVPGIHHVYNALAAVAVARELGVPMEGVLASLASFRGPGRRMTVKKWKGVHILDDAYNANPDSTWWALKTLVSLPAARRFALLGSMLELGDESSRWHRWVGREAVALGVDWVGTLGVEAEELALGVKMAGGEARVFASHGEAADFLKGMLKEGDVLLVKGSRGMALEKVLELMGVE